MGLAAAPQYLQNPAEGCVWLTVGLLTSVLEDELAHVIPLFKNQAATPTVTRITPKLLALGPAAPPTSPPPLALLSLHPPPFLPLNFPGCVSISWALHSLLFPCLFLII